MHRDCFLDAASPPHLEVISSGLDWLTTGATTPARVIAVETFMHRLQTESRAQGAEVRAWAANGYVGYTCDGCTIGSRGGHTIARLSGSAARIQGPSLLALAETVSRLDVQVTVRDLDGSRNWASIARASARQDKRVESGMTRQLYLTDGQGGDTFYLGRRVSTRFYRVYNKTAESKGEWPNGCWRFEIEYKGPRAEHWAEIIRRQKNTHDVGRSICAAGFRDYGIELPCDVLTSKWKDRAPVRITDSERQLEWLAKSVRPLIHKLKEVYSSRVLADIIGFEDLTTEVVVESKECLAPQLRSDPSLQRRLFNLLPSLQPPSRDT